MASQQPIGESKTTNISINKMRKSGRRISKSLKINEIMKFNTSGFEIFESFQNYKNHAVGFPNP